MRGVERGRRFAVISGVVFFAAVVLWVTLRMVRGDSESNDKLASVISMYVTIVSFPVAMAALVATLRQRPGDPPGDLDAVTDILATSVRSQWEAEERIRRIHDPFPLPLRWVNATENITDHWPAIHGDPNRTEPIHLAGSRDEIVDVFDRVPSRRLVVLGRAGSGKTILTSRFALAQLGRRRALADDPVPMIFSLGSWDPLACPLRTWLAQRLLADYPMLANRNSAGMTDAAALLATRRVIPVLDGFDEIPARLRSHAISAINAGLGHGDPLVLTSRADEYTAAVAASDVLTAAAVVELCDLDVEDVARYLPLTTRKVGASTKWQPVVDALRDPGDGSTALAAVLRTPLMVSLARASFSDTDADPAELLEPGTGPPGRTAEDHRRALEDVLFSGFVPAVYSSGEPGSFRPPSVEKAERWLRFLARHFADPGNRDVAWWRLISAVPRSVQGAVAGLVIAVLGNCVLWILLAWSNLDAGILPVALACGVGFVLASALVAVLVVSLGQQQLGGPPAPSRMWLRVRDRAGRRLGPLLGDLRGSWAATWMGTWTVGGLLIGLVGQVVLDLSNAYLIGLGGGFVISLVTLLMIGFTCLLRAPVDPRAIVSPGDLLRVDRVTALSQGMIAGLGGTVVVGAMLWLAVQVVYGLAFAEFPVWIGFVVGGTVAATIGWVYFYTVWGPWLLARTYLSLRGELPWPVMAFLADAHRRGVLRQSGGVYQFRHAHLQEHLISSGRSPGRVGVPVRT